MNKEPHPSNTSDSNWESLKDIPFSSNYQSEDPDSQTIFFDNHDPKRAGQPFQDEVERAKRLNRQGAKIINAFHTGKSITEVNDSTDQASREVFFGWINNNQLTYTEESYLLQTITPPMFSKNGSPEKTLSELESAHERGIIASISGRGFDNRDSVDTSDLQVIMNRYPTPVEFQTAETNFLNSLAQPKKRAEYAQDLEIFKSKFYGKRQEYHEAWQKLEQEAKDHQNPSSHHRETSEEYNQKTKAAINAEYFYPSEDLGYLAPEVQAQYHNPDYQPASEALPSTTPAPQANSKKGLFSKLFGRKK